MEDSRFQSIGNLKQALTKDYNSINTKIFSTGVISLKIDLYKEKIFILATHKRIAALSYLSKESVYISDLADYYLLESFKKEFKNVLVNSYGFDIISIFKDYDTQSELSSTIIILSDSIDNYLN